MEMYNIKMNNVFYCFIITWLPFLTLMVFGKHDKKKGGEPLSSTLLLCTPVWFPVLLFIVFPKDHEGKEGVYGDFLKGKVATPFIGILSVL